MKTISLFTLGAIALTATSCGNQNSQGTNTDTDSLDVVTMSRSELESTLRAQDSLLTLVNDISDDMLQIREMELLVSSPTMMQGDTPSKKQQLHNDIEAIKLALADRRNRLAELENKLKQNNAENTKLLRTIENLKSQIAQNEETIQTLTKQLTDANTKIANLNTAVDSLNTSVAIEKADKEKAQQEIVNISNEMNTCYYALGSKSELQKHNIIKTGFLRKTKIMQGDYEMSYFTAIDKREVTSLPLYSKKAKVLTNQPADSYRLDEGPNGDKILNITKPSRFWNASNFLVIQTD